MMADRLRAAVALRATRVSAIKTRVFGTQFYVSCEFGFRYDDDGLNADLESALRSAQRACYVP